MHEPLGFDDAQVVDELLVADSAQGHHRHDLSLAAGEQRRPVGPRQQPDLAGDRSDLLRTPTVRPAPVVQDQAPQLRLRLLLQAGPYLGEPLGKLLCEVGLKLLDYPRGRLLARLLVGVLHRISDRPGEATDGCTNVVADRERRVLDLLLARGGRERPLHLHQLLRVRNRELDCIADHLLCELIGHSLQHDDPVGRHRDREVEIALVSFCIGRIDHEPAVDPPDADRPHRAQERNGGDEERGRRSHHRGDVGRVLEVGREDRRNHLDVVPEAFGEEGADRAVDAAGREDRVLAGASLPSYVADARYLPGRVHLLFEIDEEGKEVDALARGRHGRRHERNRVPQANTH